jgi:hypothetical protein
VEQAIDSFFKRTGDLLQAGLVFAGTTWLGLGVRGFALVDLAGVRRAQEGTRSRTRCLGTRAGF